MPRSRLWLVLLAFALAVQMWGLYSPEGPAAGMSFPGADKIGHAAMFAAVVLTALRAGLPVGWVVGLAGAHAALSEVVQHVLLPDRSGDWADLVADLVGVALAALLARWLPSGPSPRSAAPGASPRTAS